MIHFHLLPIAQRASPVTTGPKLRVPAVSGKRHPKMFKVAVLLKSFRIRCEMGGNLKILSQAPSIESVMKSRPVSWRRCLKNSQ
jgi:hypothetical protein